MTLKLMDSDIRRTTGRRGDENLFLPQKDVESYTKKHMDQSDEKTGEISYRTATGLKGE